MRYGKKCEFAQSTARTLMHWLTDIAFLLYLLSDLLGMTILYIIGNPHRLILITHRDTEEEIKTRNFYSIHDRIDFIK